jgi:mycothiol synthase
MTDLTTRSYIEGDAAPLADLLNIIEVATGGEPGFTEGEMRAVMSAMVRDPALDTRLVCTPDGTLVAAAVAGTPPPGGQRADGFGGVHPQWRGRGIGRELLAWQFDRIAELHAEIDPGIDWQIETGASDTDETAIRLFERVGMQPVRYFFEMKAPLTDPPDVPAPAGLRIVEYTPDLRETLYTAHMEAFADHWGFQQRPIEKWEKYTVSSEDFRADLTRVAFDGDQIAAYVLSYDAPDGRHYVGQVGTRRAWRRRGIASALLASAMAAAAKSGRNASTLGVDADSPTGAVGVYERLGYTVQTRYIAYHKLLSQTP